jgi:hypothetical protein
VDERLLDVARVDPIDQDHRNARTLSVAPVADVALPDVAVSTVSRAGGRNEARAGSSDRSS